MRKLTILFLFIIIAAGIALRTYKLHEPLGDWHSWRQADTASVAREYVKAGQIDLFHPKYHDLSSIPSGFNNRQGWRMVEFPIRDALHAYLAMNFSSVGFVEWGRIISIIFSAITIGTIYLIVTFLTSSAAGLLAAAVYAFLPYNVYYGRVILPEPMLAMAMMLALYSYLRFLSTTKLSWYLAYVVSLTLAVMLKPTSLVIVLPIIGYFLSDFKHHFTFKNFLLSIIAPVIALTPYYFWRQYALLYKEGIPANTWLFNGNGIRLKGAWFRWLFGERIGKLILGYWGLIPFGFGLAKLGIRKKETLVYGGLLLGSIAYLVVIATGNVQHDYYQIQIMPTIAILTGVGLDYAISKASNLRKLYISGLLISALVLGAALSWYEVKGFFWVNNRAMVEAGQKIDSMTPQDSLVIAPYMGDTAFLFQTNRRGWPIGGEIDLKIKAGASYYVTTTRDDEYNLLKKKYGVVEENDRYAIIHLAP